MLLAEQATATKKLVDFQVFARDAAAEIVARSGRGIFKAAALKGLSPERKQRFFYAADGAVRFPTFVYCLKPQRSVRLA